MLLLFQGTTYQNILLHSTFQLQNKSVRVRTVHEGQFQNKCVNSIHIPLFVNQNRVFHLTHCKYCVP